jgi:hypothetical protein
MKRVLTLLAIMVLPLSVMAMTPVSDQALSDVTGQAGVSILPNVTIGMTDVAIAWGDPDGLGGETTAGWIGISGLDMSTTLSCTDPSMPITIDVATGGTYGADVTYIHTNLGTLKIRLNDFSSDIGLGATAESAIAGTQSLGVVSMGGTDIQFDGTSYMDIYAGEDCGVNIYQDINNLALSIGYVSYGDTDGFGDDYDSEGYVGLANLSDIVVDMEGTVRIDVGTSGDDTRVQITLDDLETTITSLTGGIEGDVVLCGNNTLSDYDNSDILGSIYISTFTQTVDGTVQIFAH